MDDLISRAEAIRIASGYCHWSNIPDELAKLPSVNPKPCEDAISRQAAIDAIYARYIGGKEAVENADYSDHYAEGIEEAVYAIEGLPPVTPTPKMERCVPVSIIEDIKADIKSEYASLRHRTDEDIELGECMGLKIALGIIDKHTGAMMEGVEE